MALNLEMVGRAIKSQPYRYGPDQAILYALGIGAGPEDIAFIYEEGLKVYPTFAVVPYFPAFFDMFMEQMKINPAGSLHGEHKIILHKPVPSAATLESTLYCDSIYDKGDKGAIINVRMESRNTVGELLFENLAKVFDRTAGNFGGERGPASEKEEPPTGQAPDFKVSYTTTATQAALFRLSGDKNPLHIDPVFARKLGFDRPILQGLCTFGFAGRAVLKSLCGGDPRRLQSLSCRFVHPVFPGDTLIFEMWRVKVDKYILRASNQLGVPVLGNTVAEIKHI